MDKKKTLKTTIHCTCGREIEVDDVLAGGGIRCPECHKVVRVPIDKFATSILDTGISPQDTASHVFDPVVQDDTETRLAADFPENKDSKKRLAENKDKSEFGTTRIHFQSHFSQNAANRVLAPPDTEDLHNSNPISSLDESEMTKVANTDGDDSAENSDLSDYTSVNATQSRHSFRGEDTGGFELGENAPDGEESLRKFGTPAENILKADPLYRIARSKTSKTAARGIDKGFAYGIHRIVRPHVKGGMGQVYIAFDQFLKREVALKELFERSTSDETIVRRFITEAEITAQLEHPGVVPIHSLGLDINGNPYYTMKLIRGITMLEAIKKYHKDPNPAELKRLVRRFVFVCQTMAFVHKKGVIHRDLKPANIMLSDIGETLIMDWGIAKTLGDSIVTPTSVESGAFDDDSISGTGGRTDLTLAGTIVGTPAFMSPEQADPERFEVGPRSDIFSLGGILYYLLTCRNAYASKSSRETLRKLKTEPVPRPSLYAKDIPPGLEAICLKAMQRNPDDRYQTADELVNDLCNWLDGEAISAMKETFSEKIVRLMHRHRRFSGRYILITLVSVFVLFFLAGFLGGGLANHELRTKQAERLLQIQAEITELEESIVLCENEKNELSAKLEKENMDEETRAMLKQTTDSLQIKERLYREKLAQMKIRADEHAQWTEGKR